MAERKLNPRKWHDALTDAFQALERNPSIVNHDPSIVVKLFQLPEEEVGCELTATVKIKVVGTSKAK